jgi:hypothetical protein
MPYTLEQVKELRDIKINALLQGLAPVWLVKEEFRPREDSLIFDLVFQDPSYGWMNRHFKYDGFSDVLYHLGWRLLSEDEMLAFQTQESCIAGEVAPHVPNAPANRVNESLHQQR